MNVLHFTDNKYYLRSGSIGDITSILFTPEAFNNCCDALAITNIVLPTSPIIEYWANLDDDTPSYAIDPVYGQVGLDKSGAGIDYYATYINAAADLISTLNTGFSLSGIIVNDGGSGYSAGIVLIDPPPFGSGGIQATAHVEITGDAISSIVIDNPGSHYVETPNVSIAGDGVGATGTAVLAIP